MLAFVARSWVPRHADLSPPTTVGFNELFEFIKGRRHSLDPRERPKFDTRLRPAAGASLDSLLWSAPHGTEALRVLIVDMLERARVGAADLIRLWKGQRGLRCDEFVGHVHQSFFGEEDTDLWVHEARAVAMAAFDEILAVQRNTNFMCAGGSETSSETAAPPSPCMCGCPAATPQHVL